jgi:hypothetical protein
LASVVEISVQAFDKSAASNRMVFRFDVRSVVDNRSQRVENYNHRREKTMMVSILIMNVGV